MNIAIIGSGNIGSGLAKTFGATSHGVVVASRDIEGARGLAETLIKEGIRVQASDIATAVKNAEIVMLAIPYAAVNELASAADFGGKVVIDVTNPVKADFSGITVGFDSSAAEEIQKLMPKAKVVKAFNTVFAQIYDQGLDFNGRAVPAFVAADDEDAKGIVMKVAKEAGFDAVDAGGLINARYLEPLAYLNIHFGYMAGQGTQIAPAWLAR
ncbi:MULTISPECIES: NADPH-dependent F420 reductase [unclassified Shewanella]|uniref:NADPH-dependent F420 reductase n=1 Tax=unclassified Shewanella TaxID=196818 RepID=UPI0002125F07|nr:NADPH-dependent F420 reductase [Shewanella sp. HN-41]EGM69848.1 NADP oxidoreductase, coenzyme F420-dependent [Shewanella sp. HN-41]